MRGFHFRPQSIESTTPPPGASWEQLATEAVGSVIEFWGFKRNYGRVWALLYLRDKSMTAAQIQEALGLSKGAVSMLTRDLEDWGVIHRLSGDSREPSHFVAERDFMAMLRRVLSDRELQLIEVVLEQLAEAEHLAKQDPSADPQAIERLGRMRHLGEMVLSALRFFLRSSVLGGSKVVL